MRRRFTKWYVNRGYTFNTDEDGRPVYECPWWVRPFTFLVSPSAYFVLAIGKALADGIDRAIAEFYNRKEG